MKKKIFFSIIIITIITLTNSVTASSLSINTNIPTISNIYTEGFYNFDNKNQINMIVTLTDKTPTKLIIFDSELNIEFLAILQEKDKYYINPFNPGDTVGIVGGGQVSIVFEEIK